MPSTQYLARRLESAFSLAASAAEKSAADVEVRLLLVRFGNTLKDAEKEIDGTPEGFRRAALKALGRDDDGDEESPEGPVIAVDLDGTLAESVEPFDPGVIGDPRPGAKDWMRRLADAGAYLVVHTVRGDDELVADWLDAHDIPWDDINRSPAQPPDSSQKLFAHRYVDDRAVDASRPWGEFGPELLEFVEGFGGGDG